MFLELSVISRIINDNYSVRSFVLVNYSAASYIFLYTLLNYTLVTVLEILILLE